MNLKLGFSRLQSTQCLLGSLVAIASVMVQPPAVFAASGVVRDRVCIMPMATANSAVPQVCGNPTAETPIPILHCHMLEKKQSIVVFSSPNGFSVAVRGADGNPVIFQQAAYEGRDNLATDFRSTFRRFQSVRFDNGKGWVRKPIKGERVSQRGMLMTSFGEAICTKSVVGEEGKTMSVQTANAANYRLGPTPGSVASIFGFELDPAAKVLVNGVEAPITYRSNTQLNVVIPKSVPLLTVEDGNGGKKQVPRYELRVLDGTGEVIAFDSYQAPIYSPGLFSASKNSDGALVVYGTGIVPPNASSSLKTLVYIKGRRFTPTSVESSPNTPGLDTVTLKQASVLPGQAIRVALEESCSGTENGCKSRLRRIRSNVVRMQ